MLGRRVWIVIVYFSFEEQTFIGLLKVIDIQNIFQDNYQEPTMLQCKHIFCEECVSTWFDRDTTCPMCRAKVDT